MFQRNIVEQDASTQQLTANIPHGETEYAQPTKSGISQGDICRGLLLRRGPRIVEFGTYLFRFGRKGKQMFTNIKDGLLDKLAVLYAKQSYRTCIEVRDSFPRV